MNTDYEVHIMPRHMLELKLMLDLGLKYLIFFCSRTYLLVYLLVDNILSISMLLIKNQAPLEWKCNVEELNLIFIENESQVWAMGFILGLQAYQNISFPSIEWSMKYVME